MRLAHAQGLLTKPSLNFAQTWALQYWMHMERRDRIEDKRGELELQTFNLFPERYRQLYQAQAQGDVGHAFGEGEPEMPVTDPGDLDAFYANLDAPRSMTGAHLSNGYHLLGHANGEGRRI